MLSVVFGRRVIVDINHRAARARANANRKAQQVKFGSEEYFDLLRAHPSASQWLALGNNVDLVLDDTLYSIRDN